MSTSRLREFIYNDMFGIGYKIFNNQKQSKHMYKQPMNNYVNEQKKAINHLLTIIKTTDMYTSKSK